MNSELNIRYGDRRVSGVCRAAVLAYLTAEQTQGSVKQLGKDTFVRKDADLLRIKSSNTAHLSPNQFFWGVAGPKQVRRFITLAGRRGVTPYYLLVAPRSRRLKRNEVRAGDPDGADEIPPNADAWQIPARKLAEFLKGKKRTKAGLVHLWISRTNERFILSDQSYAAESAGLDVTPWHQRFPIPEDVRRSVAAGQGIWKTEPRASKKMPDLQSSLRSEGSKPIKFKLVIGKYRFIGSFIVKHARKKT